MNPLLKKWGEQIIRNRQYAAGIALIAAFCSFFNLPIGWLSTVIIALVTLQNGPRQGLIILAWAILPAVAMLSLGQYAIFVNISILHYLTVWVFACALRKQNSWVAVIQLAALVGGMAVVAIYYLAPALNHWLANELTSLVREYKNITVLNFQPAEMELYVKYIGLFATGLIALATILSNLTTLFLARWWQATFSPMLNLQKECYGIRLSYATSLLLIALSFGLYLNSALFVNVLIVALIPFVLSGLSLLHAYLATKKHGNAVIFIFYMSFLFLSPYLVFLLSLLGWVDSFINMRKRLVVNRVMQE